MIPARRSTVATDQTTDDSVTSRLSLLRSLQRAGPRRRFTTAATPSSPAALRFAATAPPQSDDTRPGGRAAGPPAPRSWITPVQEELRLTTRAKERRKQQQLPITKNEKEKILAPLQLSDTTTRPTIQPLVELVGELICRDLAAPSESLFLSLVHLLPPHLCIRLFDIAALSSPLDDLAIRELLRVEGDEASNGSATMESSRNGDSCTGGDSDSDWESEGEGHKGADRALAPNASIHPHSPFANLTRLNLAFSPIRLPALRSLLLKPSSSSSRSLPVPTFVHLSTLNLSATPFLYFSDAFFDCLSLLLPLRHLALASKSLNHPSTVPQATFLPRLAAATPTLVSVDLSYASWPSILLKGVEWDIRWLSLKTLGMRRKPADAQAEGTPSVERDQTRRELRALISAGMRKQRRWIDVVV